MAKPELPPAYGFLAHNRGVREKIENWRTRVRNHALADLDEALASFYARHVTDVSSLHELNRLLRDPAMPERLCITEAELAGGHLAGLRRGGLSRRRARQRTIRGPRVCLCPR